MVGIAFQSYAGSDAENIGYVIPTPVINHFLDDYERNGTFTGFPALGVQWQRMESAALRCGSWIGLSIGEGSACGVMRMLPVAPLLVLAWHICYSN